jgi:predicted dehydrogenase
VKQLLQSLKNGETQLVDVPTPAVGRRQVLVATSVSLVSAGTERMLVNFGKAGWISKARQQPDKVRQVLEKARTDGIAATYDAVRSKLDQPIPLGYCNVGRVAAASAGATAFAAGDRVVSNGNHAEAVAVPVNLCAKIPDGVDDESAAFTVLAAIGLQGMRLAQPTLGECVVVTGLGLIGLLTVQLLRAQGCRVLGIDFDPARLAMAEKFGAETVNPGAGEDVLARAAAFSRGAGVDAVIITAATQSNEPMAQAAQMCRKRGRIVLVGVTGLELSRADFYAKEISFQVSCSYGPGRYDPAYEEQGQDYPIGYVRWTEQRNFEAVLDLMASGALDVAPLISHRFDFADAAQAFDLLSSGQPSLGILLRYPQDEQAVATPMVRVTAGESRAESGRASVGFLGAGNYAGRVLIPAFAKAGADLRAVVSSGGVSAASNARKHGIAAAAASAEAIFEDASIDTVVIATRHDAHARQVVAALESDKHVFCEKPLCLTLDEQAQIEAAAAANPDRLLMVGFNRRFAPHVVRMKALLDPVAEPKAMIMTVNAGAIPADHWTQDPAVGGGRLIGESCHFIDLLRHVAGSEIVDAQVAALGRSHRGEPADDRITITLSFADGSLGTVHYLANGHRAFPKERLEVFAAGRVLQLDNFRKLTGWGWPGFSKMNLWSQNKGQAACVAAFVETIRRGGPAPIARGEVFEVSRWTIELAERVQGTAA